jgi:hypothetical protein
VQCSRNRWLPRFAESLIAVVSPAMKRSKRRLLAEVAAYTVMQMMHDMAQAKVQRAVPQS